MDEIYLLYFQFKPGEKELIGPFTNLFLAENVGSTWASLENMEKINSSELLPFWVNDKNMIYIEKVHLNKGKMFLSL